MPKLIEGGTFDPFKPPEVLVGIPELCGYSASAIADVVNEFYEGKAKARVIYGHYVSGNERRCHDWTEIEVQGDKFFVCATHGQFDPNKRGTILIDGVKNLRKYKLKEFHQGDKGTKADRGSLNKLKTGELLGGGLKDKLVKKCYDDLRLEIYRRTPTTS